jgi:type VII secretion ATPase EccA
VNAREYLDTGIAALGLIGGQATDLDQARTALRRATEIDPGMCDAWVGLAAAGDLSPTTLRNAHQTSTTLHRETRRLGLDDADLRPTVASPGGYLALYPTTPTGLALAHVVALIAAGDYDNAEQSLDDINISREPNQEPVHKFVGATLHFVTQRWPDVLAWAARPTTQPASVIDDATTLLAGIAHTGLGQFDTALSVLEPLTTARIADSIAADAALYRGLCHRALGDEQAARAQFRAATIDGALRPAAATALNDPSYGPVVTTAEAIDARSDRWNPESGPTTAELQREHDRQAAQDILNKAQDSLMSLVGLHRVKTHVTELKNIQRYDQSMAQRGLDIAQDGALHMMLVGPPGTAKTSIARIMCEMYYGLGILESPEFIEVKRQDLVGEHIGETEAKTSKVLHNARGRALFIDEAPTLYKRDLERDFGRIALETIMTFAEDHRRDTMICLAGYAGPMSTMLSANSGLRSRFPHKLEFDTNTPDELVQIADLFASRYRVTLTPAARDYFGTVVQWLCTTPADAAGFHDPDTNGFALIDIASNGRFVRNVLDRATNKMKSRVVEDPTIDLLTADLDSIRTITDDDLRVAVDDVLNANDIHPTHI